ncbi:unnamed protein product [Lasius platythorax]|uniref:Uncharacterized protein n=1 Tax=Lasius platythorax TaxID=488582 RepID=A0AAV2P2I7_9HYME
MCFKFSAIKNRRSYEIKRLIIYRKASFQLRSLLQLRSFSDTLTSVRGHLSDQPSEANNDKLSIGWFQHSLFNWIPHTGRPSSAIHARFRRETNILDQHILGYVLEEGTCRQNSPVGGPDIRKHPQKNFLRDSHICVALGNTKKYPNNFVALIIVVLRIF